MRHFKPELALDKVHNKSKGKKSITFQQYVSREMALTVAWKNSDIFTLKLPRGGDPILSQKNPPWTMLILPAIASRGAKAL